jgi:hypothetical protein
MILQRRNMAIRLQYHRHRCVSPPSFNHKTNNTKA